MAQRATAFIQALQGRFVADRAEVIFNPAEYSLEKGNQFASAALPGLSNPILSFVNGDADTLTMELFFDTYTNKGGSDVRIETSKISRLLEIDPDLHAPPPVRFVWGPLSFRAVIERLSQRFTMFREDGVPVRATLNVTFKEYTNDRGTARRQPASVVRLDQACRHRRRRSARSDRRHRIRRLRRLANDRRRQ